LHGQDSWAQTSPATPPVLPSAVNIIDSTGDKEVSVHAGNASNTDVQRSITCADCSNGTVTVTVNAKQGSGSQRVRSYFYVRNQDNSADIASFWVNLNSISGRNARGGGGTHPNYGALTASDQELKLVIDFLNEEITFYIDDVLLPADTQDTVSFHPSASGSTGVGAVGFQAYREVGSGTSADYNVFDDVVVGDCDLYPCLTEIDPPLGTVTSYALAGGGVSDSHGYTYTNLGATAVTYTVSESGDDIVTLDKVGPLPLAAAGNAGDTDIVTATLNSPAPGTDGYYDEHLVFGDDCGTHGRGVQLVVGEWPCFMEMFSYGDGELSGKYNEAFYGGGGNMWTGDPGFMVEGKQGKIDLDNYAVAFNTISTELSGMDCWPCENGTVTVVADIKIPSGNSGGWAWDLIVSDTNGVGLAQWNIMATGQGRSYLGGWAADPPVTGTIPNDDAWHELRIVIDVANNMTDFYIDGGPLGSASHGTDHGSFQADVGNSVGSISIDDRERSDVTGAIYLDNIRVLDCEGSCFMDVERYRRARLHRIETGEELEGQPADQDYTVGNSGLETVNYQFAECNEDGDTLGDTVDYPWFSLALAGGANGVLTSQEWEEVNITYSTTGLTTGRYVGYLKFTDDCTPTTFIRAINVTVDDYLNEDFDYLDGRLIDKPTWEDELEKPIGYADPADYPIRVASGRLRIIGGTATDDAWVQVSSRLLPKPTPYCPEPGLIIAKFKIWGQDTSTDTEMGFIFITSNLAEAGSKDDPWNHSAAGMKIKGDKISFQINGGYSLPYELTGGGNADIVEIRMNKSGSTVLGIDNDITKYYFNGAEITDGVLFSTSNPRRVVFIRRDDDSSGDTVEIDDITVSRCELPCNTPFADTDEDGDVDQDDFATFQLCYSGSLPNTYGLNPSYCACFDRGDDAPAGDGDIDASDFDKFKDCASGPNIPVTPASNPSCDFN
ncbi:MAG: hypothetical protein ACYTA5_06660, partial [Planctomycetota bacterium]